MDKCSNCGEQLEDGIKVCSKCNTEKSGNIESIIDIERVENNENAGKSQKSKKPIIIIGVVAVIVVVVALLAFSGGSTSVNGDAPDLKVVFENTNKQSTEDISNAMEEVLSNDFNYDYVDDGDGTYNATTNLSRTGNQFDATMYVQSYYPIEINQTISFSATLNDNELDGGINYKIGEKFNIFDFNFLAVQDGNKIDATIFKDNADNGLSIVFNNPLIMFEDGAIKISDEFKEEINNSVEAGVDILSNGVVSVNASSEAGYDYEYVLNVNAMDLSKFLMDYIMDTCHVVFDMFDISVSYGDKSIGTSTEIESLNNNIETLKEKLDNIFDNRFADKEIPIEVIIKTENDKVKYIQVDDVILSVDSTDNYATAKYTFTKDGAEIK